MAPRPRPQAPPAAPPAAPPVADKRSFLGAGCELKGEFTGEGSFECGGDIEGTIDIAGDLVIGQSGTAKAEIKARRIDIEGRLEGNVTGTEKVEVGAAGHVEGDVRAPAVQFAEGAFFEGNVEMRRTKAKTSGDEASDSAADVPAKQGGPSAS